MLATPRCAPLFSDARAGCVVALIYVALVVLGQITPSSWLGLNELCFQTARESPTLEMQIRWNGEG